MMIFVLLVGGCGVFLFSLGSGVGAKKKKKKKKKRGKNENSEGCQRYIHLLSIAIKKKFLNAF